MIVMQCSQAQEGCLIHATAAAGACVPLLMLLLSIPQARAVARCPAVSCKRAVGAVSMP
jgi:hypothetical protein